MAQLPMFPLGSVLFPTMILPLHVFEPRYRALVNACLDGDREFGVVLIERGSEVGGGDVRTAVGTVAQIVEAEEFQDGRWAVGAVGTRRIRVLEWLDDDPYPQAEVEDWLDSPVVIDMSESLGRAESLVRRVAALRGEVGESAGAIPAEFPDDAVLASYQLSAVAPLGMLDRQRLLAAPQVEDRLADLEALLVEEEDVLRQRLAMGDP